MYNQVRDYVPYVSPVMGNRFGMEIEAEGEYLPPPPNAWSQVADGSLRGNSCEYITRNPSFLATLRKDLSELVRILKTHGTLSVSDRCGVHLHMNVQNLRVNHLYNLLMLYFIIEDCIIDKWAPERKGNLFCLSASEAEGVLDWITSCTNISFTALISSASPDRLKYGALNLSSIGKFGTLEYRALSTPKENIGKLLNYLEILKILSKLKANARQYASPMDIVSELSHMGAHAFAQKHYPTFLNIPDLEQKLYKGIRMVQEIAYVFEQREQKREKK